MKYIIKNIELESEEAFLSDTPNQRVTRHTGRVFVKGAVQMANGTTMDVKNALTMEDVENLTLKEIAEKLLKDIFEGEKL